MQLPRLRGWRSWLIFALLIPAITGAAAFLGYATYHAAVQRARLGDESLLESTLLLVREKVDQIEQQLIRSERSIFRLVELDSLEQLEDRWLAVSDDVAPSVVDVVVLDGTGYPLIAASRQEARRRQQFLRILTTQIVPTLELEKLPGDELRHLHQTYEGRSELIAYLRRSYLGESYILVAHHDTRYIAEQQFPILFASKEGRRIFNVVNENDRRIFGPNLAKAGDYLVGRRFPTTLYQWRLQIAPKRAPLLKQRNQTQRLTEVALLVVSFVVILVGIAFVIYATIKERTLNTLRTEFIADVSHELKTPLSIVRMFSELLASGQVQRSEKVQEYIRLIHRESERLSTLIDNVLDFSALEQGRLDYDLQESDLLEVIRRSIDTFRSQIELVRTEVSLEADEQLPRLPMDEQAVILVMVNLLDNAVKYGNSTPIHVTVKRMGDEVQVTVRDHGPGIPKEDVRRVFRRFFRSKGQRQKRGSGIGLSIVSHIAQAHGGRAWADNPPEGGALFGFSLPIAV